MKLTFTEKNDLIVKHQNRDFFYKDLELFKKHLPIHALINELAQANEYSFDRLDGQMLYALLDIISIDEVLENRGLTVKKPRTLDELKQMLMAAYRISGDPKEFDLIEDEVLIEINKIEDIKDALNAAYNIIDPKIDTIDLAKQIFIDANLNIEQIEDSFFEDFVGCSIQWIKESIPGKFSFLKHKPGEPIYDPGISKTLTPSPEENNNEAPEDIQEKSDTPDVQQIKEFGIEILHDEAKLEPRTEDGIRTLLIEQFELNEADLEALSEIISLWLDKSDEEIISAVKKLLGAEPIQGDGDQSEGTGDGDKSSQISDETSRSQDSGEIAPLQPVERDNVKTFTQRINEATTIQNIEAILREDKEGGERSTVQKAGQKRIEILKVPQEDLDGKKKDQSTTSSQE